MRRSGVEAIFRAMMNQITTLEALQTATAQGKTAVYVHATWCPFCRVFKPVFERVLKTLPELTPIDLLIDDEENPIWEKYGIETIPTILMFENGVEKDRLVATPAVGLNEKQFRQRMEAYTSAAQPTA